MRVGIDLGTTYSSIADMGPQGRPRLIPDCTDPSLAHTPSVVHVAQGSAFVGHLALALLESDPQATVVRFFKRQLGSPEPLLYDEQSRGWRAEGLAALVLKKLAYDAESMGAARVEGAVVTVPAHFGDTQRKGVLAAAALARVPVLGLVEEPVAAALHYGLVNSGENRILLVYDFGGGTFDATVLRLDAKGVHVLAKTGPTDVGGKEIDERVAVIVLDQLTRALGRPPETGARMLLELRRIAERLKIELSLPGRRAVRRTVLLAGHAAEVELRRHELDAAIADLVARTEAEALRCVEEAGLVRTDVSDVLMVGGSSFVPLVEERLRALFCSGQRLFHHEPSKAVAFGAALHAARLAGDAQACPIAPELRGVTGYNVGVRTVDAASGRVSVDPVIKKNMTLPVKVRKTYYTTRARQERIVLDFVEYRDAAQPATSLGRLLVGPLPALRANHPIEVTTECRVDGTVAVEAYDAQTGIALSQVFGGDDASAALVTQKTLVDCTLINNLIS